MSDLEHNGPSAAEASYYRWLHQRKLADLEVAHAAYLMGFAAGAKWTVMTTAALAPSIASLADLVAWLKAETQAELAGALNGGKGA